LGVTILQGVEFPIFLLIFEWALQQCAACDGSTLFLNMLHKLLLKQHVNFPTRARGADILMLLDLVITDDQFVHNVDTLAPLGKSDHAVLMIQTDVFSSGPITKQKFNYDKGDYDGLR